MLRPELSEGLFTSLEDFTPGASVPLAGLFGIYGPEDAKLAYEDLLRHDSVAQKMLEDCYLSPDPDMEWLSSLPEETFGKQYYHYLVDNNLDPDLLRKSPSIKQYRKRGADVGYWMERLLQLHDIWHVLTGYDTSRLGEVKVVSFTVAQIPTPYPTLIIATRPLQAVLYTPERLFPIMDAITEGWKRGRSTKPLMGVPWEEMFDQPLLDLQREYNLI